MAANFPSSPTAGQVFYIGKVRYVFTSGAWTVTREEQTALPFNFFVNPAFQISQQNASTALTASSSYSADQWWASFTAPIVITHQRVAVVTPNGSPYRMRITVTTPDASLTTTDNFQYIQRFEGTRLAAFNWGNTTVTTAKLPMVVRFGFKGPAGTYTWRMGNGLHDYSYVQPFTITAGQANTDQMLTFAVPVPPAGTWQAAGDTTCGGQFSVCFAFGPNYLGVAGWQAGGMYTVSGATNGVATAGLVYELFDMGMYLDPLGTGIAPPWEYVSDAKAVFESQRYWQRANSSVGIGIASTASPNRSSGELITPMRGAPTPSLVGTMRGWDQATAPNLTAIGVNYSNTLVGEMTFTAASAQTTGRATMVIDVNNSSIYIAQNARI